MRFLCRTLGLAALASLVSSAACPRLAAACDVALPDIREYSGLENQTAVDLDLVAVQSGAGYFYSALPKLGAHLETLGGALVPTSRNDVDAGVSLQDAGLVRSVLVPAALLSADTDYVLIVENALVKSASGKPTTGRVSFPFHTGKTTRPKPVAPLLTESGIASVSTGHPSTTVACCAPTSDCGGPLACRSSTLLSRQLRTVSWGTAPSTPFTATVVVESTRAADEAGWTNQPGKRTQSIGNANSVVIPLAANERACVRVTLTDPLTLDAVASEPLCLDGPGDLPAAGSACADLRVLASGASCGPANELSAALAACDQAGVAGAAGAAGRAGLTPVADEGGCAIARPTGSTTLRAVSIGLAAIALGAFRRQRRAHGPRSLTK